MRWLLIVLLALLALPATAVDPLPFANDAERERYHALAEELRCLVCQNQSLADSNAELAGDLRRTLLDLMQAGRSDAEIKRYLVERYGDFVLYKPPLDGRTAVLWFGPGVLVVIALVVVVAIVRRRRRRAEPAALRPLEDEEW